MATILNIAGHGPLKNGGFDPGATGYITQGEHKYYTDSFFKLLKKYEPKGHKVIYHTAYNVYDYGNLVSLARQYGNDVIVIEWHFDATGTPDATGGHVIVYSGFNPDELDLRLRDGINNSGIGVRYEHRGHRGISGRSNLANPNRAANGGINYRLIELGFGTSPRDSKIMLNDMDKVAKAMSEAIYNTEIKGSQQQDSMAGYYTVKSGDTLWGIGQTYNVTVAQLKSWNKLKNDLIFPGQSLEVRGADLPAPKPEPKPPVTPPAAKPTNQIKVGDWVRVPANKLYAKGDDSNPVKSKAHSGKVETINNGWKNQLRLKNSDDSYLGFARISDITGSKTVAKPTPPKQMAKSGIERKYKESGTFYPNTTILVSNKPSTKNREVVAEYHKGENLNYHTVHLGNGYVWLQYDRKRNGKTFAQGYIPCRTYNNGKYGTLWGTIK